MPLDATDIMALKNNDGNAMGEGMWLWWFIIILFLFNGNGFGGNSTPTNTLNNDFITRDLFSINQNVSTQGCETRSAVEQSRYDTLLGVKDIEYQQAQGFMNTQNQLASCCCELKTLIHSEGEQTRAMINTQIIQNLRDRLALAENTNQINAQSQTILTQLGTYYTNPSYSPCCNY